MRPRLLKALALYTGGKDSHYAIMKAQEQGIDVKALLTAVSKREDSWMFHVINIRWTRLHAEAMSKKIIYHNVSGIKEKEVDELEHVISRIMEEMKIDSIVTGAVASMYQKQRIDKIARRLGIKHIAPLWGLDQEKLLREEVERIKFIITAVQAYGLTEKWLGTEITIDNIDEFLDTCRRYGISPVGEGGEFETFVIDSPLMKKRVSIIKGKKVWFPAGYGYFIIEDALLEEKSHD